MNDYIKQPAAPVWFDRKTQRELLERALICYPKSFELESLSPEHRNAAYLEGKKILDYAGSGSLNSRIDSYNPLYKANIATFHFMEG